MDSKNKGNTMYDLIPKSSGWNMKVIGKTESDKTKFVSLFFNLFN